MAVKTILNKIYLKISSLYLAYLFGSFVIVAMIPSPLLVDHRAGAITLTNFEGYKPFQYRVLMPLVIRGVESATLDIIKDSLTEIAAPRIKAKLEQRNDPAYKRELVSRYVFRSVLFISLNILLMFLFMIALRYLARAFNYFPGIISDLLPLGLIFIMPLFYDYAVFVYDFCHLFLFTLGMYLLYKRDWFRYLIIFALGILNKETAVMLVLVFIFNYFSELSKPAFYKLLAAQVIIFLAIKSSLYLAFMGNPGSFVEWQLGRNIEHLSAFPNYFIFKMTAEEMLMPCAIDLPLPKGLNLPMFAVLVFTICYKWRSKPFFLRKASLYFAVSLILTIFWGYVDELRANYDALPIIYLLSAMGIYRLYHKLLGNKAGSGFAG